MPAKVWPSNYELERQIDLVFARYNREATPFTLHLFKNDLTIAADWDLEDLIEADFDGYAAFELFDQWEAPIKVEDGLWSMRTLLQTWEAPAEGEPQTVYGAWIEDEADGVLAANLVTPWVAEVEGDPLRLRVIYRHLAAALLEVVG